MSKIMRELYAEARAAREKAELEATSPASTAPEPSPAAASSSGIDWWNAQYAKAGEALVRRIAAGVVRELQSDRASPAPSAWR
jgi:hypothetical protein